ncbi:MAG: Rpn family recombination-promoting nuclease/putative transposase [Tolypothrix brevis GSE-NOS-MK-07-07A]|jgi:predicted transposase YdaD|nr:Rpn family recombination-promoting nuclease/putative transposase [Tolypothrix brevis GSE-NOS-MK-07-07A]
MQFDNLCKYLAEKYPQQFANWLLGESTTKVEVLKTELSLEPIRADSVTFLRTQKQILHLEFQVQVPTGKSMPLRMLNYWVRLHWQYGLPVTQVLIWLKATTNTAVFENEFQLESTRHGYQVIRMWEQSPEPLLQEPALLPFASLCAAENSTQLLSRVAQKLNNIEESQQRREIVTCTQLLAGLRFSKNLIVNLITEGIMRESVIFQEILEEGRQEEALVMTMRLLTRLFATLDADLQGRIRQLTTHRLEDLSEALLDFSEVGDLITWLEQQNEKEG